MSQAAPAGTSIALPACISALKDSMLQKLLCKAVGSIAAVPSSRYELLAPEQLLVPGKGRLNVAK